MAGNNSIQFLRGTSSQRATHSETSLVGQPIFETDTNKLYVGDGATLVKNLDAIHAGEADGITATQLTNGDLHDFRGAEYWGKTYYATGVNSVLNKPAGVGGFVLEVLRGGGTTTVHRLTSSSDSSGESVSPNVYMEQYITSWTNWEEIATGDGTYSGMTVGRAQSDANGNPLIASHAENINGTDFNNYTETGLYEIIGNSSNPMVNMPVSSSNTSATNGNWYLWVFRRGGTYITQVAYSVRNDNAIAIRSMSNGTWGEWRTISDQGVTPQAETADRLSNTSAVGSTSRPVYFSADGVPVACGNSLNVDITGNAETATHATTSDSATKATQDGSGNVIANTYATKTGTYSDMTVGNAETANTADKVSHSLTAKVNNTTVTFDGSSAVTIPTVFAPNSGGAVSNWLRGNGSISAPVWDTLPIDGTSGTTGLNTAVNTRTINHYLGYTPTKVFCQLYNPSNNGINYYVTSITSTAFTVEFYSSGTGGAQSITGALFWLALK